MEFNHKEHSAKVRAALENGFLDNIGVENIPNELNSELEEIIAIYGQFLIDKTDEVLTEKDLKASGDLAASAQFESTIKNNNEATLGFYLAEHWVNVHYGDKKTREGGAKPPPVAALMKWITSKGLRMRKRNSESTISVLETRKRAAFAIRNAIWNRNHTIKRYPQPGSRFVDEVLSRESLDELAKLLGEVTVQVVAFGLLDGANFSNDVV